MKLIRKKMTGKVIMTVCLAALAVAAAGTARADDKPTADLTVGFYSQYIWRGYELSRDSLVIQPSMTVGYRGFGFNLWGNLDTAQYNPGGEEPANWNETDMTLSYDGAAGMVGYTLGYIYYGLDGIDDSQDIYAGVSLDTILSPTLTVYHDVTGLAITYITLDVSYAVPVSEKLSLDLGAKAGYLDDDNDYRALHDGVLSVSLSIPVTDYVTVAPELYYSFPLSSKASDAGYSSSIKAMSLNGEDDSFVYGGLAVSLAF